MIAEAQERGVPWTLTYGGRSADSMAYPAQLRQHYGDRVALVPQDEAGPLVALLTTHLGDRGDLQRMVVDREYDGSAGHWRSCAESSPEHRRSASSRRSSTAGSRSAGSVRTDPPVSAAELEPISAGVVDGPAGGGYIIHGCDWRASIRCRDGRRGRRDPARDDRREEA